MVSVHETPVRKGVLKSTEKTHLLTVALEDYFHATALEGVVSERHWRRLESRVVTNTHRALELLDESDIKATFFVLGWIAERIPGIVAEVAAAGHEVACKTHYPRTIWEMSPKVFRDDLRRSRHAVESAAGVPVFGHRIARGSFTLSDLWALDILAEEGFAYDSSIFPRFRSIVDQPWRRFPHKHLYGDHQIYEFPLSSCGTGGFLFPSAGGNYIRQFPPAIMRGAFAHWHARYGSPFNMYFHVWELDPDLPKISGASLLKRVRQYRNIHKMPDLLRYYFERYRFNGIADRMGLKQKPLCEERADDYEFQRGSVMTATIDPVAGSLANRQTEKAIREPVTIVVPCYNEEQILPYLSNTIEELKAELQDAYDFQLIFVDDGSRDNTWDALQDSFGGEPSCELIKHDGNKGVAAAIMTGIRAATTEIVCSMDCDCTYDPRQLKDMLPLLSGKVSIVTSSPYHERGRVLNVPGWRLFLSRSLSRLYRVILSNRIATVTSCFRVYRRSAVVETPVRHGCYLGLAELLAEIDLRGGKILEYPAVLESRLLGYSKMNTLFTIVGHVGLYLRMAWRRVSRNGRSRG